MTVPKKYSTVSRGKPIPRVNEERFAKNWARAYHSLERCAFVKSLPCLACGAKPSENAHIANDGKGR